MTLTPEKISVPEQRRHAMQVRKRNGDGGCGRPDTSARLPLTASGSRLGERGRG